MGTSRWIFHCISQYCEKILVLSCGGWWGEQFHHIVLQVVWELGWEKWKNWPAGESIWRPWVDFLSAFSHSLFEISWATLVSETHATPSWIPHCLFMGFSMNRKAPGIEMWQEMGRDEVSRFMDEDKFVVLWVFSGKNGWWVVFGGIFSKCLRKSAFLWWGGLNYTTRNLPTVKSNLTFTWWMVHPVLLLKNNVFLEEIFHNWKSHFSMHFLFVW